MKPKAEWVTLCRSHTPQRGPRRSGRSPRVHAAVGIQGDDYVTRAMDKSLPQGVTFASAGLLDYPNRRQFQLRNAAGVIDGESVHQYDFVHPARQLAQDVREPRRLLAGWNHNADPKVGGRMVAVRAVAKPVRVWYRQRGGNPVYATFAAL